MILLFRINIPKQTKFPNVILIILWRVLSTNIPLGEAIENCVDLFSRLDNDGNLEREFTTGFKSSYILIHLSFWLQIP